MVARDSYTEYIVENNIPQSLQPPKRSFCRTCCGCASIGLSYLLVAYMSADMVLLMCLKTNCTLPNNSNLTGIPGKVIDLHNKNSIQYLIISEGIAGILFFLIILFRCYNACKINKCIIY